MRAVIASRPGGSEVLTIIDRPSPEARADEVVIAIAAAGVNRADISQREGSYPPPPGATDVLGLECAGVVVGVGSDVTGIAIGDRVRALLAGGGYAERVAVPAAHIAPVPEELTMVEAASLMEAAATAWSNLFWVGGLRRGETVLVHGGSSGIGTMAIQLAVAAGARVVTTAGSDAKLRVCRELGAELTINYRESDFVGEMSEHGMAADVILDIMGGAYLARNVRALATGGRLVVIGLQGGMSAELELDQLFIRRASVTATSLRARSSEEKGRIVSETVAGVWPSIAGGQVRPVVHEVFDLEDVARAHEVMAASEHIGKLVLTL